MPTDVSSNGLSASFEAQLHVLRTKYFDSLQQKETELEDIIVDISAYGADKELLTDLYVIVHNLAGTASTHGFHEVGMHAFRIEKFISDSSQVPGAEAPDMKLLLDLECLTNVIRQTLDTCRST